MGWPKLLYTVDLDLVMYSFIRFPLISVDNTVGNPTTKKPFEAAYKFVDIHVIVMTSFQ